jgi:hypothetical protein
MRTMPNYTDMDIINSDRLNGLRLLRALKTSEAETDDECIKILKITQGWGKTFKNAKHFVKTVGYLSLYT